MATYSVGSIQKITDAFVKGQEDLAGLDIDIVPEENNIDPLEALRLYQGERTLENGLRLATLLCVNKRVTFTQGSKLLLDITPVTGKPLQNYFDKHIYLLEVLVGASWGILLKKLTPPLGVSAIDGGLLQ